MTAVFLEQEEVVWILKNITLIYFLSVRFAGNAQLLDNQRNSRALKKSHLNLLWLDISHAILKQFEIIGSKYLITVVRIACFNPVPSRIFRAIYYQGDKKHPCVGE